MKRKPTVKSLLSILGLACVASSMPAQASAQALPAENDPLKAVVKVNATAASPDFFSPWRTGGQQKGNGTGVVIAGNLILTNAHNVADAKLITISKNDDGFPMPATVFAVNHQCDLALLKVEDTKFFDGITPFEIGETPPVQSQVFAVGYPLGGDGVSITQGIVSRIETVQYSHSYYDSHLAAQLDAAINPGNSGGPVIFDGKIAGIAFQGVGNAEGVGYMIHTDVIRHFLKDVSDGKVDGFGMLDLEAQTLENPSTRRYFKMRDDQSGIAVCKVKDTLQSTPEIKVGDVLLEIDGFRIMNNGKVKNERGENVLYSSISDRKQFGETVGLKVLRDGKEFAATAKLTYPRLSVAPRMYDKTPNYFIIGGFVFSPLTLSYLDEWQNSDNPPMDLVALVGEPLKDGKKEVVVLAQVMGDEVNIGYENMANRILEKVNGKKISCLKDLAEIIDAQKDGYVKFEFKDNGFAIIDIKEMKSARARIEKNYKIPSDRSADLK